MQHTMSPAASDLIKEIKKAYDTQNIFGIRNNVFADATESERVAEPNL
jgi:hypothetical protein